MIPDIVCISFVIFSLFLEANKLFSFSSFFWNVETLCLSKSIFIHFTDQLVWVMGFQYLDCVHFYMFYFNYFLDSFFSFSFLSFWNYYFGMFDFPVSPLDFLYSLCYLMFFLASFSSLYNQPFLKNFSFKSHIFSFKSSFFCTVPFFVCLFFWFIPVSCVQSRVGKEGWQFWTKIMCSGHTSQDVPLSHLIFTSLCNAVLLSLGWPSDLLLMNWISKSDRI